MAYDKITLYGKQTCDYLYIQKSAPTADSFSYVNDEPSEWNDDTTLSANFSNIEKPLSAGNSELIGSIEGYEIRRRKYNESYSEYIGTIKKNNNGFATDFVIDYAVKNETEYTYYLYPRADHTKNGTALSPVVTKQVSLDCPYWSLFVVDETEEENVFFLDKMFKFELNLQEDDMQNNAQISVIQNFTKYPTLQHGTSNYWGGSLSSLCGFVSCNHVDYVQNVNMIQELKSLSSDTRRKFLKDMDGNLWEVDISSPINISTNNATIERVKTLKFSWVEVGDAEGVSIINNPNKSVFEWVLTETGEPVPYITYVWDEQYVWDDSYMWTEQNDSMKSKKTNLGRNISG